MADAVITSRANPLIKELRDLKRRKGQAKSGQVFVEGIQPVLQALDANAHVDYLIVAPELLTSESALQAIKKQRDIGTRIVNVSGAVFESLADREHPSGLAAAVSPFQYALQVLPITAASVYLALYEVGNPGNLGAIIRTADAFGGSGVILIGDTTDPYHPTAIQASRGAVFSVPVVRIQAIGELLDWCRARDINCITASDSAQTLLWQAELRTPLVFVLGSEGKGLPQGLVSASDLSVTIPMQGEIDSLNLAVAASVLLYEVRRREMIAEVTQIQ